MIDYNNLNYTRIYDGNYKYLSLYLLPVMIGSRIGLSSNLRLSSFAGLTRCFVNSMTETVTYPGIERWKGRVAVVTGASAGMGYQLAKTLAQLGVVTIGCARNPKTIEVSISVCLCVIV